jgi:hypothetical protein
VLLNKTIRILYNRLSLMAQPTTKFRFPSVLDDSFLASSLTCQSIHLPAYAKAPYRENGGLTLARNLLGKRCWDIPIRRVWRRYCTQDTVSTHSARFDQCKEAAPHMQASSHQIIFSESIYTWPIGSSISLFAVIHVVQHSSTS